MRTFGMIDACPEIIQPWWKWYPPVGVFIASLALLGVLVPLFRSWEKLGKVEKAVWTALFFILVGLEIRSIYLDRDQHDRDQRIAECQQLQSFEKIANKLNSAITLSEHQYQSTIEHVNGVLTTTQTVANVARHNLDAITGGNSYAYVIPVVYKWINTQDIYAEVPNVSITPQVDLLICNAGKQILTGVTVDTYQKLDNKWMLRSPTTQIGTLAPRTTERISIPIQPRLSENGTPVVQMFISAQNGTVSENIYFRKSKNESNNWAYRFDVFRETFRSKNPIKVKSIDWTEPQDPLKPKP